MATNNDLFGLYNRYKYYDVIYDTTVGALRIGLGWQSVPKFPVTNRDTYYTVENKYQYRLDLISLHFFGSKDLSWVLFAANDIQHPVKDIVAGTVLRIPDPQRVKLEV